MKNILRNAVQSVLRKSSVSSLSLPLECDWQTGNGKVIPICVPAILCYLINEWWQTCSENSSERKEQQCSHLVGFYALCCSQIKILLFLLEWTFGLCSVFKIANIICHRGRKQCQNFRNIFNGDQAEHCTKIVQCICNGEVSSEELKNEIQQCWSCTYCIIETSRLLILASDLFFDNIWFKIKNLTKVLSMAKPYIYMCRNQLSWNGKSKQRVDKQSTVSDTFTLNHYSWSSLVWSLSLNRLKHITVSTYL